MTGNSGGGLDLRGGSRADSCDITLNGQHGAIIRQSSELASSTASRNDGEGVILQTSSMVRDCSVSDHVKNPGLSIQNGTAAIGNRITGNKIGILVNGDRCLVDSNALSDTETISIHLLPTAERCSVIGNRIQANTNWILDQGTANDAPLQPNPANASAADNLQL